MRKEKIIMTDLIKLQDTINSNNRTSEFFARFKTTKVCAKQLVEDLGNIKTLEKAVFDTNIGKTIVDENRDAIAPYVELATKVVAHYTTDNEETVKVNKTQYPYPARMKMFISIIDSEMQSMGDDKFQSIIDAAKGSAVIKDVTTSVYPKGVPEDKKGDWNVVLVSLINRVIVRQLIIEAIDFVKPEAVDENGNEVKVEQVSPDSDAHHQDEPKTEEPEEPEKPVIVDATPEPEPTPEPAKPETTEDIFTLVETQMKSQNGNEKKLMEAVAKLLADINEKTPKDLVERTANLLKPVVLPTVDMFCEGVISNSPKSGLNDEQMASLEFHKGIFTSMLPIPHKDVKGVDIDKITSAMAFCMRDVSINDLETDKRDGTVAIYAGIGAIMYTLLDAVVVGGAQSVIRLGKFFVETVKANNPSGCDMAKLLNSDVATEVINNFSDTQNRVNNALWTPDNRPYAMGQHLCDGMAKRQAEVFLRDGIAILKDELKKATAA
jgi:hypothetical protein